MNVEGKRVLVLGGAGLVGAAVCRELLAAGPATLIVASRQKTRVEECTARLREAFPDAATRIVPVCGDVFLRADWQSQAGHPRAAVLNDPERRGQLVADMLDTLDENIIESSLLAQFIEGRARGLDHTGADTVIDCINTATAVSYQNVYAAAEHLRGLAAHVAVDEDSAEVLQRLLASLYIPQLVRHVQLLLEAMRRAGTQAYIKVGTSGTGGMGFNIPYTHGEEKPSRLLLSKAALAGAQSALTFLMARTPGAPRLVREFKPAAVIGWKEIAYGEVTAGGREIPLWDCPPALALPIEDPSTLVREGAFGEPTGDNLKGTYIDTGENGRFTASEFTTITSLGQMQLVTPEEIARIVVTELTGGNTGRDIVAALDGAVLGPSYRGGFLRQAAINKLHQLEAQHGEAAAFGNLGPPRLSKLLFEAYLLKQVHGTLDAVIADQPAALATRLEHHLNNDVATRRHIISIGIGILLPDGNRLLRGPQLKATDAHGGWVDLTAENMLRWQERLKAVQRTLTHETTADTSSLIDRNFTASREWRSDVGALEIGETVAWVFNREEHGQRGKN
jgi:nucleoside-diphosphate-sugar epimerase